MRNAVNSAMGTQAAQIPTLSTEDLSVGYGRAAVVDGIRICAAAGEILCLIGPNGAGKSTFLKTLIRQLQPMGGTVLLENTPLPDMKERELARKSAAVLTGRIAPELMTCEEVVAMGRYPYTGMLGILSEEDKRQVREAMELVDDEVMPCVSPLGYPAEKMSIREAMMRKAIKAESRMAFEELFFDGDFGTPLTQKKAGRLAQPLEMVRLAPSAVNRQPWRVVVKENAAHFYLKRAKGMGGGALDMQKIDMGIALCHFDLAAQEAGLASCFAQDDPGIETPNGEEYIASWLV